MPNKYTTKFYPTGYVAEKIDGLWVKREKTTDENARDRKILERSLAQCRENVNEP